MNSDIENIIQKLNEQHCLELDEYESLIINRDEQSALILQEYAVRQRKEIYGNSVYVRGLIEISNICKNDCYYCGIRRSNKNIDRYRLSPQEIMKCADDGYDLGFRTFVLQGGEDSYYCDELLEKIIMELKSKYDDIAITLSLGERSFDSCKRLYEAGADRYLLRHETADPKHYGMLHPEDMSYYNRMNCLHNLKQIGYQVGCGFMVGSPYQTPKELAEDLKFIQEFQPDMCGIGPFVPHRDTRYKNEAAGSAELTCYLLSIIRLIKPNILLPSTTALGTIHPFGRELGIQAGANVVMPNLSPVSVRKKYELYDNKICTGEESAQCKDCLSSRIKSIGYEIVVDKGDIKPVL
ncbi:MAG: [FeFe] hydrogenase H-cluster radical SAM maturase HydE [Eubacterium sp.]